MPTPSVIEIDPLLAPILGDQPAGSSLPFEVRDQLEKLRKEDSPDNYAPDDPRRPESAVKADWVGIVRLCQNTLTQVSKDLQVAARLTEALAWLHGFPGVRDGLRLLRRLVGECWDRLLPPIEEPDDVDRRAAALNWLDDPDRGSRFPTTVQQLSLVHWEGQSFGWVKWKQAQEGRPGPSKGEFEQAAQATPWEACQKTAGDVSEAVEELDTLVRTAADKMGQSAPSMTNLRQALAGCQTLSRQILARKAPPPVDATGTAVGAPAAGTGVVTAPPPQATTREEVYRQLAQAAAVLQKMEPHSPIPYLILREVELGTMTFPDLMQALIRDENVLAELSREFGIKKKAGG
jgi:type VI secretion system protein ImpA